jgi:hypothetical protein
VEAREHATALLRVKVATASSDAVVEQSAPTCQRQAAPAGSIYIELPGRAAISVESGTDRELLQTILAWIIHEQTLILKKVAKLGALAGGYLRLSTHCHS